MVRPPIAQPAPPVPLERLVHVRARVVIAAFAAALCLGLVTAPMRATYEEFSGTTVPARSMIRAPGSVVEATGGRIVIPVVDRQTVSVWGALRGWLDPASEVARFDGHSVEERDIGARHMERAARVAAALAPTRAAGAPLEGARLDAHGFGGPSAGLAFALELVDQLSPGDLTRGLDVAATGELTETGEVVAVGGIEHKAIAAARAGVDVFVVPAGNFAQIAAKPRPYRVVPVRHVDEAIEAFR